MALLLGKIRLIVQQQIDKVYAAIQTECSR